MSDERQTTVVVVEDDHMVRDWICVALRRLKAVTVIGEAANGRKAISVVDKLKPDIVILDIGLPQQNGIDVALEIHQRYPQIGVIMLSGHAQHDDVMRSFKAGARGYVSKAGHPAELEIAVAAVSKGEVFISPVVAGRVLSCCLDRRLPPASELERLTARKRQVLQLIAEGAANKEVARILGTTVKNAEKHRYELMKKLRVRNAAELAIFAVKTGLVDPSRVSSN